MIEVATRIADAAVFGVCPDCLSNDGYLNIRSSQYFVCHAHQFFWFYGVDMFDDWRFELAKTWRASEELLAGYQLINPFTIYLAAE